MMAGLKDGGNFTTSAFGAPMDVYHVGLVVMKLMIGKIGMEYVDEFLEYLYSRPKCDMHLLDLMATMLAPEEKYRSTATQALKVYFIVCILYIVFF